MFNPEFFNKDISSILKIKLNLFDLKPKAILDDVYKFYKGHLEKYFDKNNRPIPEYFKEYDCQICFSKKKHTLFFLDHFEYVQCEECQSVYNRLMLKDSVLEEMYNSGIYLEYFKKLVAPAQTLRKETLERRKVAQVSSFFKKPGKILDVGCGSGSFLKECQQVGWSVYGIDPSQAAIKTAKEKYDLELTEGFFESHLFHEKFDCIVFIGLEHMQNPMGSLKKAESLLNPGGVIFFEVPNADSLFMNHLKKYAFGATRYIESGRHYLFFSNKALKFIAETLKMEQVYIETNGLDLQTIIFTDMDKETQQKLIDLQDTLNDMCLGDHFRVFLRKK